MSAMRVSAMRARRGVALMAALWLVVAIAAVALQFSLEAHERRTVGIRASERGIQQAAAEGALALMQARMEQALRVTPSSTGQSVALLRSSDPWLDADSTFSGQVLVDSMPVSIVAHDLGEKLNINQLGETDFRTFFSFLLGDYSKATQLSQTIMDWRDPDSLPRPVGAERDDYIKAEMLALPTNTGFRDVDDLRNVMGMTPEIYAASSPYFTTKGPGAVNLNTAPVPVLRTLPGMTDATLNMILQLRSQGRRIANVAQIFPAATRGGRPRPGQLNSPQAINALAARTTVTTNAVELTISARATPQSSATTLYAIMQRAGTGPNARATVTYQQW
jgi:general secretion pathway protein K